MRRRIALPLLAVLALAAGCGRAEIQQARAGPAPLCAGQPIARTLLVAQSVPGSDFVPCYDELPIGLELEDVMVDSSGARFRFDIDRYDSPVWLTFSAACDVGESVTERPEQPGVVVFTGLSNRGLEARGAAFHGGCMMFEFGDDSLSETAEARALVDAVELISREELSAFADWEL